MSQALSFPDEYVLEPLLADLEAEGFDVFVHPPKTAVPSFMQTSLPDAIAYKGARKIAIKVVGRRLDETARRLLEGSTLHPEWDVRIVVASPRASDTNIPVATKAEILSRLDQIESTLDVMGEAAAVLYGWAVFEAAARLLKPESLRRAQTPANLLETLASDGYITPDEADTLRRLGRIRNEVAHGRLDRTPERGEVEELIRLTRVMLAAEA